ncbi:hypothetical protein VNO80_19421 [Phaseolus coccineus]|uniref:Cytochrome P450 n=1 Tax=Phaseolus coccineus TaxID=3886 RepID=A0AAN9MG03_PHACN
MLGAIREACSASKGSSCVNLSEILIQTSNNIISRCVLGRKYDNPEGGISFGELGRKMMKHLATFSVGDFFPLLGWIDVITGQIPEFKATFRALDSFFDQLIAERKRIVKSDGYQPHNKDFLETLLQIQDGAGKHDFQLTHDDVKAILMDIFAGGSDTTSTLLEWVFAALLKNPDAMKRAQEEIPDTGKPMQNVDMSEIWGLTVFKKVPLHLQPELHSFGYEP